MVIAQELGEKISRMFNFIYEVNNDYYILGRDYFRLCTDLEIGVYKGFKMLLTEKKKVLLLSSINVSENIHLTANLIVELRIKNL